MTVKPRYLQNRSVTFPLAALVPALLLAAPLTGCRKAGESEGAEPTAEHAADAGDTEAGGGAEAAGSAAKGIEFTADAAKMAGIVAAPVGLKQLVSGIPFNGQIVANPNGVARVASLVPGRVTRLAVAQGDSVRAGQVVAIVESGDIGTAQSAYQQAVARLQNARSNLSVVLRQARAGVFSRAPVEVARKAQADAAADARTQETAVRQARVALDNTLRLVRVGGFASPALEAARTEAATSTGALRTAQAALDNARAATAAGGAELKRRQQMAASGAYQSRPVQEAQRALVTAQGARAAAQSTIVTTRANLERARTLAAEGLVSGRDLEAAQQAYDTATASLESAQSDEVTARQELERQQKLAATDVAGVAEVQAAQAALATARADVRTRSAEVEKARSSVQLARVALSREQAIFRQNIANRREVSTARAALENAQTALVKARQTLAVANAASQREQMIFRQNLNNIAQVQTARAAYVQAQADLKAARTALALLKSEPDGSVSVPVRAPIGGVVQERNVAAGELIQAGLPLMTIVNLDAVALEAALYEKDFTRVRHGSPLRVTVDALPGRAFSGRITFLGAQLDPQTRTVTARALIANPGVLRPGMFAHGHIQAGAGRTSIVVPEDAVQTLNSNPVVFVPGDEPLQFEARPVEAGDTENGQTVIKTGLKPGERVVIKGAFMVKAQAMKDELKD